MRKQSSFGEIITKDAAFVTQVAHSRSCVGSALVPMHAASVNLLVGVQLMQLLVSPTDSRNACIKRNR